MQVELRHSGDAAWLRAIGQHRIPLSGNPRRGFGRSTATLYVRSAILAVSQFTLYGDVRKGKRPSFDEAAPPPLARELYEYFVLRIRESGFRCETGRFQAMMQVELVNDGPVTILVDSKRLA